MEGAEAQRLDRGHISSDELALTEAGSSVNPTLRTILERHSVRHGYRNDAVASDLLEAVIAAGEAAPSSKNARPWAFHAISDPALLAAASEIALSATGIDRYVPHDPATGEPRREYISTVTESCGVLASVPLAIFIENRAPFSGGRWNLASASVASRDAALMGYGLEMLGIGGAIQNMWLAANSVGLAAAFLGDLVIGEAGIRQLLNMDGDFVGALAIGRSDATSPGGGVRAERRDAEP